MEIKLTPNTFLIKQWCCICDSRDAGSNSIWAAVENDGHFLGVACEECAAAGVEQIRELLMVRVFKLRALADVLEEILQKEIIRRATDQVETIAEETLAKMVEDAASDPE